MKSVIYFPTSMDLPTKIWDDKRTMLELLFSWLAPHDCMSCGCEGSLLCEGCTRNMTQTMSSRCFQCRSPTEDHRVCPSCRSGIVLSHVWVSVIYEGIIKRVIYALKFDRAMGAKVPLGLILDRSLPSAQFVIIPVPTSNKRIRERGYDQSVLLARGLARTRNLTYVAALVRVRDTRQTGSTRRERIRQQRGAFIVTKESYVKGKSILLVDDIVTTGATLDAAARVLLAAGATDVNAVVIAQKL